MAFKKEGESSSEERRRRDELLLSLLKTPPQPRPKRDRGKRPNEASEKPGADEKPEPSA